MGVTRTVHVAICMGSSCFSRGNNRIIEVIQRLANDAPVPVKVEARGHLCEGLCKTGPNVLIDGTLYSDADAVAIADALQRRIAQVREAP